MFVPIKPFKPSLKFATKTIGLYYKHVTIVNYNFSIVNKLGASFTDDARVVIYDNMFIVQTTELTSVKYLSVAPL